MVLAMIPAFSLTASAAFDGANGGSGTEDSPYEIATADQLGAFRDYINGDEDGGKDEYFKMTADIDLGGAKWTPIGTRDNSFQGTFDGGGHAINGLYVPGTFGSRGGLFCRSAGTIKNLTVSGSVNGDGDVGSIVGENNGTISNCHSDCTLEIRLSSDVGGIAGSNNGGSIENCYNTGTVIQRGKIGNDAGGITGDNSYGSIKNCYNVGAVICEYDDRLRGGIAARNTGSIENCYYLDTCGAGRAGTSKTAEEFNSGEVTWSLQNGQETQAWGQKLGEEADANPVLTSEESKKVLKVTFATQENEEYFVKYTNPGTVEMPENPEKDNYTFVKWATTQDVNGEKFDEETPVTEDITVYAVGGDGFGGDSDEIPLNLTYGEGKTLDLSQYMAYENEDDTKGKFTYTIANGNTIGASVTGDDLIIPKDANVGEYSLTVKAAEKSPDYVLMSVDTYGVEPVTLNVKVTIEKATPTASVWANELVFKNKDQYLVTGKTDDGTLMYSTSENGDYSEKIPTGKDAGDYTVWYKVVGDDNHTDSEPKSITVSIKNIEGISIEQEPTHTTIIEGMPLDASGLIVTADCGNGDTFEAHGYTLSGYDTSRLCTQTVTVTYAGKTAEFNINVIAKSLTSIAITHKPDKLTYYRGDELDTKGMVITAFYNNNTSEFVDNDDCTVSGSTDNIGAQTVTVTYSGQTAEFTIAVLERPAPTQTVETPLIETADFYGGKRVIISCATEGADIYYTTDGTNPTATESKKYTASIELTESAEIKAIAVKYGMNVSNVAGETVTVEKVATPVASVTGEVEVGTTVKLLCTTSGAEIYYAFGDSLEENNYKKYTGDIVITGDTTIRVMAAKRGYAMSDAVTFTYTVAPSEEEPSDTNRVLLDAGESACKAGRTFRLPAYVYSEKAIKDFRYTLSFDSNKFEYVGLEAGDDVPVSDVSVTVGESSVTVRGTVNNLTAAEACVLVFKAKSDVEVDGYVLPVSDIEINTVDDSLTEIWYLEGYVTIIPEDTYIFADAYLTDAEDNILEYMEDVKGELTAYILAQPAEMPEDGETVSCDLILAFYDTDGALVMVNTTEAELSDNMNYFEEPITIPENTEIGDVKLMVWDKVGTMKPLTEVTPVVYPYSNDLGE